MTKSLRIFYALAGILLILFAVRLVEDRSTTLIRSLDNPTLVETVLSHRLGQPVHIGQIGLSWHGLNASLNLENFVICDAKNTPQLTIRKLKIGINLFASFIKLKIVPGNLYLEGTQLVLTEKPGGLIDINGIPYLEAQLFSKNSEKLDYLLDSFLTYGVKELKDVNISWYDQDHHLILPIKHFALQEHSQFLARDLEGQAELWNKSQLNFNGHIYGTFLAKKWTYTNIHFNTQNIDLNSNSLINHFVKTVSIKQGQGNASFDMKFKPHRSLQLSGFAQGKKIQVEMPNHSYQLDQVTSRFFLQQKFSSWLLQLKNLQITTLNDQKKTLLPIHKLIISEANNGQRKITIDNLPLLTVSQFIIENNLASKKIISSLRQLNPTGTILNFIWQKNTQNPDKFFVSGRLNQVGFSTMQHYPAMQNLSGDLFVSKTKGNFKINSSNAVVDYQSMFRYPYPIEMLKAQINWCRDSDNNLSLKIKNLNLKAKEGQANGYMNITVPKEKTGTIIHSKIVFKVLDASNISKYSPISVMPLSVVDWLDHSIKGGAVNNGLFILDGNMKNFPFDHAKGKFLIKGDLTKGLLHNSSSWPDISDIDASLRFKGRSMDILSKHANIFGATVPFVEAKIDNLENAILSINGQVKSTVGQTVNLNETNNLISQLYPKLLSQNLILTGAWQLDLNFQKALAKELHLQTKVAGHLNFNDVAIKIGDDPLLNHLKGKFDFTDRNAQTSLITAELWDKPLQLNISSQKQNDNVITQLAVKYNNQLNGLFNFESVTHNFRFDKGNLTIDGTEAKLPSTPGLTIIGNLAEYNLDKIISFLKNKKEKKDFSAKTMIKKLSSIIHHIDIKLGKLQFGNFNFTNFHLQTYKEASGLASFITSDMGQGEINLPYAPGFPIRANFQNVTLPANDLHNDSLSPDDVSALDLTINNLQYKEKLIKNMVIKLRPISHDEVLIKQLTIQQPDLEISAFGKWRQLSEYQQTWLNGEFQSNNLGNVLNQWQFTDNMINGRGNARFNLSWNNSPLNPEIKTLNGTMDLKFNHGTITKLSSQANFGMDMGRVLTLFSLQTLPRRLMLDFSDLTEPGFSFDDMVGRLQFAHGNIYTDNAILDGPVAKVRVNGRIGLSSKDYNLRLTINPYVTSSLPLVATITAGPVVGAATWLADRIFSHQMKRMTEIHYNVTGSWDAPDVNLSTSKLH